MLNLSTGILNIYLSLIKYFKVNFRYKHYSTLILHGKCNMHPYILKVFLLLQMQ